MSRFSPVPRPHSNASITSSGTTYQGCDRAEPYVPATPSESGKQAEPLPTSYGICRHDSGYESLTPRSPRIHSRRRSSTSVASSGTWPRARPSVRKTAPKSRSLVSAPPHSTQLPRPTARSQIVRRQEKGSLFDLSQIPPAERGQPERGAVSDSNLLSGTAPSTDSSRAQGPAPLPSGISAYPSPPQTTHYWTSDRTRRLEYAAIDAASRGVRGWVMRHMVPDCFIPDDCRRVRFDDDRGSVVRYRLELEEDDTPQEEGCAKKRKTRWFSTNTK